MTTTQAPPPPAELRAPGVELWDAIVADFELGPAEAAQLEEACRTRDRIRDLDAAVAKDGIMIPSSQGMRLHPAVAEARAHRLAMARILATLGVPGLDEDAPAARPVRGVYAGRGRR
ncbi:P27 family phage terminase small subunit [Cellulosimicrobium sp. ES-005]|uniref:P27 family phage terminase small subunit n=1 Tax=Cellulosimicrobium sp. ES-005 TaxID=3163031 RepID=A0AAU8G3D8_9MICO